MVADAREALEALTAALEAADWQGTAPAYRERIAAEKAEWDAEVDRHRAGTGGTGDADGILAQPEIIGIVNDAVGGHATVICAAGSLPGDLLKLWRPEDPKAYHLEYGYSCMGYEIAAGLGVQLADPERHVVVMVGDGSYLMLNSEIVTAVAERLPLTVVVLDNHGYQCILDLARDRGVRDFGNELRFRDPATRRLTGDYIPVDFRQHAESMGAVAVDARHARRDPRRARRGARPRPAHGRRRPDVALGPRPGHGGLVGRAGRRGQRPGQRARGARPVRAQPRAPAARPAVTFRPRDPNAIGVAVLGAGRMGQTHLRNIAAIPNARVVVVADPSADAAATGRELARADRASTDPLEAIHDPAVEAVVIATPTSTHAALIEAALRAGKAVWSEKPIAQDIGETARIVDLWRETGIPVQLGFMRRFDPGYQRAKQLIDAGELGRIEQFRASSRDTFPPSLEFLLTAGGSFLDMAVHDLDLARFLVGEVEEVHAWAERPVRRPLRAGRRLRHGGDDAPVPQRRPRRRRDGPPLRLGLRHPDRGRRRRGQGGRRRRAEDAGDAPPAVRLRGRPVRELSRPVRGGLPPRARGVLRRPRRGTDPGTRAGRRARDPAPRRRRDAQLARGPPGPTWTS